MKTIILIMAVFFVSCETTVETKTLPLTTWNGSEVKIVIIDGCEYLYVFSDTRSLTHKGNCSNPIHPEHIRHN